MRDVQNLNVTKASLPNRKSFHRYVDKILDSGWLTNRGQYVQELEAKLEDYLGVKNLILVNNATSALQVAYKALGLTGEVITTPFTFIATASSIKWSGLDVVFADIDKETFNIDVNTIEQSLTDKTSAIVPVHVFGNPCDVDGIEALAHKHGLKVIYDAAHAFGVQMGDESILNRGDISILSFHATKLFHTIEGGALIVRDDTLCAEIRKMINFGFTGQESIECLGINAKMNEFQAAMGLCLLDDMKHVITRRGELTSHYDALLSADVVRQKWTTIATRNHAYYPVVLDSEETVKKVQEALNSKNIYPRRYFYPSLDTLPFLGHTDAKPVARDIASRILCLPLFPELSDEACKEITHIVNMTVQS